MLSYRSQHKLAQLLIEIAQSEIKIEVVKQVVCELKHFEPYTVFKRIDKFRNGYLSINDLETFLQENEVKLNKNELINVFHAIDVNRDGNISYQEFLEYILPQENPVLREMCTLRKSYNIPRFQTLEYDLEWALTRLFKQISTNCSNIYMKRQSLLKCLDFIPQKAFNCIDEFGRGFFSQKNLEKFMASCDQGLTPEESDALFRVLDIHNNQRVNYKEFEAHLKDISRDFDLEIIRNPHQYQMQLNSLRESLYESSLKKSIYEEMNDSLFSKKLKSARSENDLINSVIKKSHLRNPSRERLLKRSQELLEFEYKQKTLEEARQREIQHQLRAVMLEEKQQKLQELERQELRQSLLELQRLKDSVYGIQDPSLRSSAKDLWSSNYLLHKKPKLTDLDYQSYLLSKHKKKKSQDLAMKYQSVDNFYQSPNRLKSALKKSSLNLKNSLEQSQVRTMGTSMYMTPKPEYLYESQYIEPSVKKQMSLENEAFFVENIAKLIETEVECEENKKKLALRSDFNCLDGFRFFDQKSKLLDKSYLKGKGYITSAEFEQALINFGLLPSKDEIFLFFKRFDTDNDGLLKYSDFCKIMSPQNPQYSVILRNRKPVFTDQSAELHITTIQLMKKLLACIIEGELKAERFRRQAEQRPNFNIYQAFTSLDQNENGFVSIEQFKQLLTKYNIFVQKDDLLSLIKRFDKNLDGRISYSEFVNEFTPKSPQKF